MQTLTEPGSAVTDTLRAQRIELQSWAFGNSGTRFKVFPQAGVPRDPYEKIADAALARQRAQTDPQCFLRRQKFHIYHFCRRDGRSAIGAF